MSFCKYCGSKVGLFKSYHKECELAHTEGIQRINHLLSESVAPGSGFYMNENEIREISRNAFVCESKLNDMISAAFDKVVESFLEDGLLSPEEEGTLIEYQKVFSQSILNKNESLHKVVKGLILRDIIEGKESVNRAQIITPLPFLLQKNEYVIWLFNKVEIYEQRVKTVLQGRSEGVGINLGNGIYYRFGSFKGIPTKTEEMQLVGVGVLAFTNNNIYFASSGKGLKLPYKKIITTIPYSDGLGLQKEGATSKPIVFKDIDGWFSYNLIRNLVLR